MTSTAPRARRVSGWTVAWIFWVAFFLAVEGWALIRKGRNDTFSEHWWALFRVHKKVPRSLKVGLALVEIAFGVWLTGHLAFGWWTT